MKCTICNFSGFNMRRCKKCGKTYCRSCANKGKLTGKPVPANKCPYCGVLNQSEQVK